MCVCVVCGVCLHMYVFECVCVCVRVCTIVHTYVIVVGMYLRIHYIGTCTYKCRYNIDVYLSMLVCILLHSHAVFLCLYRDKHAVLKALSSTVEKVCWADYHSMYSSCTAIAMTTFVSFAQNSWNIH